MTRSRKALLTATVVAASLSQASTAHAFSLSGWSSLFAFLGGYYLAEEAFGEPTGTLQGTLQR